jgi:hypothetical protein
MLAHLPDEPISMPEATEGGRYASKAIQPCVPPTIKTVQNEQLSDWVKRMLII